MQKVFVSSVITDYAPYRETARQAIALMDYQPVLAEDFGPRDYSPEAACLTEVAQADVYLLLLGSRYGFKTAEGLSVTQAEFRQAVKMRRPVLALVEQTEMEPAQRAFCDEVENYSAGFYRGSYSSPDEAKNEIIRALRQLENRFDAASEADFEDRLTKAAEATRNNWSRVTHQGAHLRCAWWPQPVLDLDLKHIEHNLDSYFDKLCETGLAMKRHGYEPITGKEHTGIRTEKNAAFFFEDGLIIVQSDPTAEDSGPASMAFSFVPPSKVKQLAMASSHLFAETGAWCQIRLEGLDGKNFTELPTDTRGPVSIPMYGDHSATHNQLLIPYTIERFEQTLERAIGRFERTFSQRL